MVPGANSELRPAHVDRVLPTLEPSVVLVQMEIPPETVARAAALGQGAGARVLLDPAPVPASLSDALMTNVDLLLPNEGELATLTGLPVESVDAAARAAATLRCRGVRAVVVKRGSHRALVVDAKSARSVPAPRVDVIDTTGAGDCFDGALAVALVEGRTLDDAVRFATHAAALACARLGAQSAQPTRAEVERLCTG